MSDNIFLVTIDSLRADHCGFQNYKRETTPYLDQLASEGIYFEQALASGIGTPSSMSGILTGDYPNVKGHETAPDAWRSVYDRRVTLPEILREHGYSTAAFTPNAFASSYFGFDRGFDHFEDFLTGESKSRQMYNRIFDKVAKSGKSGLASSIRHIRDLVFKEEIFKPWEDFFDEIISWTESASEPYFVWVLLLDSHHPYLAPRDTRNWSSFKDMWYSNWKLQDVDWEPVLSESVQNSLIDSYDDSIRYSDKFLKRLGTEIDYDSTNLIIHGDHGEAFGEHGIYGHGPYLYEEFINVPLVLHGKIADDLDIGETNNPVSLKQIGPSILKYNNIYNPFQSNPLDSSSDWTISTVLSPEGRRTCLATSEWRFLTNHKKDKELYHLPSDRDQQNDISNENPKLTNLFSKIVRKNAKKQEAKSNIRTTIKKDL